MHVLLEDELGRLTLYRLRPWDRVVAQCLAWRLDRELARGACPETNVSLAARATTLTSMRFRRDLAASLQRLLMVAGFAPANVPALSAPELAELASRLIQPEPVPARGVAMVCQLLTDVEDSLYRETRRDDLAALAKRTVQALNG
jgi:hypothetical protein